jgi:hypothetical protein
MLVCSFALVASLPDVNSSDCEDRVATQCAAVINTRGVIAVAVHTSIGKPKGLVTSAPTFGYCEVDAGVPPTMAYEKLITFGASSRKPATKGIIAHRGHRIRLAPKIYAERARAIATVSARI